MIKIQKMSEQMIIQCRDIFNHNKIVNTLIFNIVII
jgi:hypothetical protein